MTPGCVPTTEPLGGVCGCTGGSAGTAATPAQWGGRDSEMEDSALSSAGGRVRSASLPPGRGIWLVLAARVVMGVR